MKRRSRPAAVANPVLVGAVTILVVVVAVFLAYNANAGLPFVPTYELKAQIPNGAQLVKGNDVREGGNRIGTVTGIDPRRVAGGASGAELTLKLSADAGPVPADSSVRIRPRSALGLKYVELQRGTASDTLPEGSSITAGEEALAPELQQFFNLFDEKTRVNVQDSLGGFGDGFAGRGQDINRAFASLPRFLRAVPPVFGELADPANQLPRFFKELGDAARVTAPIAEIMADGFAAGADTFEALSRDPGALQETISESPDTLTVGTSALAATRPFLNSLADVSGDVRLAAAEIRRSAPSIDRALASGVEPLKDTPALSRRLTGTFDALTDLAQTGGSETAITGLEETMSTLTPLTKYLGPYVTVCNYWNYSWTFLADHITDKSSTGGIQRIRVKNPSSSENAGLGTFGQGYPTPTLHAQAYGAAIDAAGNADCEQGQRGFPRQLAEGLDPNFPGAGDPETPGNQGPTFTGRARVPAGQTFSNVAEGGGNLRP